MPSFMNTIIIEGPFMPEHAGHRESGHGVKGHYGALGIEMAAHFVIMYLVMYTMIATLDHFYFNNNTFWMTLMMVTPMALIMMLTMRPMFPSRSRSAEHTSEIQSLMRISYAVF